MNKTEVNKALFEFDEFSEALSLEEEIQNGMSGTITVGKEQYNCNSLEEWRRYYVNEIYKNEPSSFRADDRISDLVDAVFPNLPETIKNIVVYHIYLDYLLEK